MIYCAGQVHDIPAPARGCQAGGGAERCGPAGDPRATAAARSGVRGPGRAAIPASCHQGMPYAECRQLFICQVWMGRFMCLRHDNLHIHWILIFTSCQQLVSPRLLTEQAQANPAGHLRGKLSVLLFPGELRVSADR